MGKSMIMGLRTILVMLLLVSSHAWAADGRILMVQGKVTINGEPASAKGAVSSGDTIKAGRDGVATIVMNDNSVLNVQPNSEIAIADFVFNPDDSSNNVADVNIIQGTLRYISGQIAHSDPDKVSIRAGTATIGIRGTIIEASFDGVTVRVNTALGTATISMPGRAPVVIPVGNAGTTDSSGATSVAPAATPAFVDAAQNIANDSNTAATEIAAAGDDAALVVAALAANAGDLGADVDSINAAVAAVAAAVPEAAAVVVFIASVIMPDDADSFASTATDTLTDTLGAVAAQDLVQDVDDAKDAADNTTVTEDGGDTSGGTDTDTDTDPATEEGDGAGTDPDTGDTGSNDSDNSQPPFSGDPANTSDSEAGQ